MEDRKLFPQWKKTLVDGAAKEIAKLQEDVGIRAEVVIERGDVLRALNRAWSTPRVTSWSLGVCLPVVICTDGMRGDAAHALKMFAEKRSHFSLLRGSAYRKPVGTPQHIAV